MKYILWAQNESTDIPPTIVVDNELVDNTEKKEQWYSELCKKNKEMEMSPTYREERFKESSELYEKFIAKGYSFNSCSYTLSANYSKLKDGIYIQGCYLDKDVRGRVMPYMFFTSGVDNMEEAQEILKKASSLICRTCNTFELAFLNLIYKKKSKKKKVYNNSRGVNDIDINNNIHKWKIKLSSREK